VSSPKAFGDMLRRQREKRGITVKAIAEQTKIGASFLEALERGDCSKWPGGIYSRAWIRAYGQAIGLDPEEVASQFARWFSRNAFLEGETVPVAAPSAEVPRITPLRLTLESDPQERLRVVSRRAVLFVADTLLIVAIAIAASMLPLIGFWTAFAAASVVCHAIGLFGGGGSAAGWIDRTIRRHARPHEAGDGSAVAEAA